MGQTRGRQCLNIHCKIDLQAGQTGILEALTVDVASITRLLEAIGAMYSKKRVIHLFVDNARYHPPSWFRSR